jgi:hypothetical protein
MTLRSRLASVESRLPRPPAVVPIHPDDMAFLEAVSRIYGVPLADEIRHWESCHAPPMTEAERRRYNEQVKFIYVINESEARL